MMRCARAPGIRRISLALTAARHFRLALALLPIAAFAQSVPLIQDSYILPGSAGNYGNQQYMNVGGPNAFQSLLQFDLTSLPAATAAGREAEAPLALLTRSV